MPDYIKKDRGLAKAEWALLEVTDGILRGSDLRELTGIPDEEGDAILAFVKKLREKHAKEWKNAEWMDMATRED